MIEADLIVFDEDQLDILVSNAIRRAELLDDAQSPAANDAWREVMQCEARLAEILPADEVTGGVARAGAVRAALAAGDRTEAERLAALYLAESSLPAERRDAIERAFRDHEERLADRFPALARGVRIAEMPREVASGVGSLIPRAA